MKTMKKIATLILAMSLAIACFAMPVYAANGKIMFTDPTAKTGENVEVKGVIKRTDGNGFGKVEVTMTYDATMLKFVSGNGVAESQAGTIVYVGDATNDTGARHEFKMQFTALKEGSTKLEVSNAVVKSVSGSNLNYTKGASTITIAKGEGTVAIPDTTTPSTEGTTVEVNGTEYTISNEFPEAEIPVGYTKDTLEYGDGTYNVVYNETTGIRLAYLISAESQAKFFMYMEEDATFAPYEQIAISDSATIVLLSDISEVKLPDTYKKTSVVLNGEEFPAWHNTEDTDFYILYALNNKGEEGLYQLDNAEMTYQRFAAPEVKEEKGMDSFIGKLSALLENHLDYVILGTGLGFLVFVIIIVILGVKLYNRNAELDEIYDEYDLNDDDEEDDDDEYDDETDDDVMLDLEDEAYEEDAEAEEESFSDAQTEIFVQEGMKEVFPEEDAAVEESEEIKKIEDALPEIFAEMAEEEKEEEFLDEEEAFENFSIDFIDLDD